MKTAMIRLDTIQKVKDFVNELVSYSFDVDLVSGKYVVDAKSIMGIFSLDLSHPIELRIYSDDCDELLAKLAPYLVK